MMRLMAAELTFNFAERVAFAGGRRCKLRAKCFDLLALLASRPGHLFPKQVLLDEIWNSRAVTDDVLTGCVREIRAAIGDDARTPTYIQTISGIGYRFVATCHRAPAASREVQPEVTPMRGPEGPTVAVVAFRQRGPVRLDVARALGRDIANGLARTRWLTVAASASCERLRGAPAELIARQLSVRYLVEGEVLRSGRSFSLAISLSDMAQARILWADRIERDGDDMRVVMEDVCAAIVAAVESEIEIAERRRAMLSPVRNLDAWTGFHKGMSLLQSYDPSVYGEVDHCLRTASRADPACSRLAAARSWLHWQQAFLGASSDRKDSAERARAFAGESVALDARDPLGHWATGRAAWLNNDLDGATRSLRRAVSLNPSSAIGHYSLGYSLCMQGCVDEAIAHTETALRLSPHDPIVFTFHALNADLQIRTGADVAALAEARAAAAHPNVHAFGLAVAAWVSELCGEREEALAHLGRARSLAPGFSRESYFAAIGVQYDPERQRAIAGAFDKLGF